MQNATGDLVTHHGFDIPETHPNRRARVATHRPGLSGSNDRRSVSSRRELANRSKVPVVGATAAAPT